MLHKLDEKDIYKLIEVQRADVKAQAREHRSERIEALDAVKIIIDRAIDDGKCFSLRNLAITGKDLIGIGYTEGSQIGAALNMLLSEVVDGKIENDRETLLAKAAEMKN
jgi:tRNA nucleotidyltransferase (CCA-adding enzyme)